MFLPTDSREDHLTAEQAGRVSYHQSCVSHWALGAVLHEGWGKVLNEHFLAATFSAGFKFWERRHRTQMNLLNCIWNWQNLAGDEALSTESVSTTNVWHKPCRTQSAVSGLWHWTGDSLTASCNSQTAHHVTLDCWLTVESYIWIL